MQSAAVRVPLVRCDVNTLGTGEQINIVGKQKKGRVIFGENKYS